MHLGTDTKIFAAIIIATIAIVIGGIFFMNKPSAPQTSGVKADNSILIRDDSYQISTPSAKAVLVEFADFQCPACGTYHPVIKQLLIDFKNDLDFVYRNYPLSQHANAPLAAQAAEAAGKQDKFWEMHDLLFENQDKWSDSGSALDIFTGYAQSIKLDINKFKTDINNQAIKDKINRDISDGNSLGVNSTPTFFLNGEKLVNPSSYDDFKTLIKAAILKSPISQAPSQAYHIHANFKVVLNGQAVDFTQSKYQSPEEHELDPYVHLHDGVGDILHVHKKGETLADFFKSLKITFNKDCFILDTGDKFCNGTGKTLAFYVNGKPNDQFENYQPQDLDRILISYGSNSSQEIQTEISNVSDAACIYSLKCPQRGKPPTEHCVGGLGSDCK